MDQQTCNERHDRIDARLKEVEGSVKDLINLVGAIKELAVETKYMREDVNQTIHRVDELESKDSGKWDKFKWLIVAAIVSTTVGVVIGYFFALISHKG
jgi:ABC-type sugar transport system permease subunit